MRDNSFNGVDTLARSDSPAFVSLHRLSVAQKLKRGGEAHITDKSTHLTLASDAATGCSVCTCETVTV